MQRCRLCIIHGAVYDLMCPEYPPPLEKCIAKLDTVSLGRLQDGCQEPMTSNCHLLEPSLTLVNLGSNKTNLGKLQWIIIKYSRLLNNLPGILSSWNNSDITKDLNIHELNIIVKMIIIMAIINCIIYSIQFSKINSERQTLSHSGFIEPWTWTLWSISVAQPVSWGSAAWLDWGGADQII